MDDEQLKALRDNGGVIQVVAFNSYLKCQAESPERQQALAALRQEFGGDRGGEGRRAEFQKKMAEIDRQFPPAPRATVQDLVNHIDYVVKLIGLQHVGISSDFDGGGGVTGWNNASETMNVTLELVRRGYTEEQIGQLWSGNLLRVMEQVDKIGTQLRGGAS
jgi:membrane dipeptidase